MPTQAPANLSPTDLQKSDSQAAFIAQLKRLYNTDQQAEFLFIQAEADSLLIQLERIKSQQQPPASPSV